MFKSARLFAALLALVGAFAVPQKAQAFPISCMVAENIIMTPGMESTALFHWAWQYYDRNC